MPFGEEKEGDELLSGDDELDDIASLESETQQTPQKPAADVERQSKARSVHFAPSPVKADHGPKRAPSTCRRIMVVFLLLISGALALLVWASATGRYEIDRDHPLAETLLKQLDRYMGDAMIPIKEHLQVGNHDLWASWSESGYSTSENQVQSNNNELAGASTTGQSPNPDQDETLSVDPEKEENSVPEEKSLLESHPINSIEKKRETIQSRPQAQADKSAAEKTITVLNVDPKAKKGSLVATPQKATMKSSRSSQDIIHHTGAPKRSDAQNHNVTEELNDVSNRETAASNHEKDIPDSSPIPITSEEMQGGPSPGFDDVIVTQDQSGEVNSVLIDSVPRNTDRDGERESMEKPQDPAVEPLAEAVTTKEGLGINSVQRSSSGDTLSENIQERHHTESEAKKRGLEIVEQHDSITAESDAQNESLLSTTEEPGGQAGVVDDPAVETDRQVRLNAGKLPDQTKPGRIHDRHDNSSDAIWAMKPLVLRSWLHPSDHYTIFTASEKVVGVDLSEKSQTKNGLQNSSLTESQMPTISKINELPSARSGALRSNVLSREASQQPKQSPESSLGQNPTTMSSHEDMFQRKTSEKQPRPQTPKDQGSTMNPKRLPRKEMSNTSFLHFAGDEAWWAFKPLVLRSWLDPSDFNSMFGPTQQHVSGKPSTGTKDSPSSKEDNGDRSQLDSHTSKTIHEKRDSNEGNINETKTNLGLYNETEKSYVVNKGEEVQSAQRRPGAADMVIVDDIQSRKELLDWSLPLVRNTSLAVPVQPPFRPFTDIFETGKVLCQRSFECRTHGAGPLVTGNDGSLHLDLTLLKNSMNIVDPKVKFGEENGPREGGATTNKESTGKRIAKLPLKAARALLSTSFPLSWWVLAL